MNFYNKIINLLRIEGIGAIPYRMFRHLFPQLSHPSLYKTCKVVFQNKLALEVGGPSRLFEYNNLLPIYEVLQRVDGCNFSTNTVWEGDIVAGENNYKYSNNKKGIQYVNEGSDLSTIPSEYFDIILSCHSLEHIANPIKALKEWKRVLKSNGYILLILPAHKYTFDHQRPITKIKHLIEDYERNVDENDLSCMDEVLKLHDLSRDPLGPDTVEQLKDRSLKNYENRCLHHHVFDFDLVKMMAEYVSMRVLSTEFARPFHLISILQKND